MCVCQRRRGEHPRVPRRGCCYRSSLCESSATGRGGANLQPDKLTQHWLEGSVGSHYLPSSAPEPLESLPVAPRGHQILHLLLPPAMTGKVCKAPPGYGAHNDISLSLQRRLNDASRKPKAPSALPRDFVLRQHGVFVRGCPVMLMEPAAFPTSTTSRVYGFKEHCCRLLLLLGNK